MSDSLILILSSIFLIFLIFPLLFFLRRRVDLRVEDDILVLEYPLNTKKIDLEKELESWEVQEAYYIRWGMFYSINILLKSGKRVVINSFFNQKNYDLLYDHLSRNFSNRKKGPNIKTPIE